MPRRLRAARVSVFAVYATIGFLIGVWAGNVPLITQRAGVTPGLLGVIALIGSVGIVAGAQLGGRIQQRFGTVRLCLTGLGITSLSAVGVGFVTNAWALLGVLTVFCFGGGLNDVGMNMQAVFVERAYRRPIMSAFHALYPVGGALGALLIFWTATLHWSAPEQLGLAAAIAAVSVAIASTSLLRKGEEPPDPTADADAAGTTPPEPGKRRRGIRVPMTRLTWLLGLGALTLMSTEGVAGDWSALQLRQAFGAAAGISAVGYTFFSVAMIAGRLSADRVAARFGPAAVVRFGSLIGLVGLVVIVVSPSVWLTLAGWAALGLGISGGVPQIFTAAGNQPNSAIVLSRVLTFGYVGVFGGPAIIGLIAQVTTVTDAMLLPIVLLIVAVLVSGALRRRPDTVRVEPPPDAIIGPRPTG